MKNNRLLYSLLVLIVVLIGGFAIAKKNGWVGKPAGTDVTAPIEELSVASSERMEDLEAEVERLEEENSSLRNKLRKFSPSPGSES